MRIVVSGTHATGKSTLISDFAMMHRHFAVLSDPFELVDAVEAASTASFAAQLQASGERLLALPPGTDAITERGPLDFLAYLHALDALGRSPRAAEVAASGEPAAAAAMAYVDLLVVLPLDGSIAVPADEDPELRAAMDDSLLELADEGAVGVPTIELSGDPATRLSALRDAVRRAEGRV